MPRSARAPVGICIPHPTSVRALLLYTFLTLEWGKGGEDVKRASGPNIKQGRKSDWYLPNLYLKRNHNTTEIRTFVTCTTATTSAILSVDQERRHEMRHQVLGDTLSEKLGKPVLQGKGGFFVKGGEFVTLAQAYKITGIAAPKRERRERVGAWGDYATIAMFNGIKI